MSQFVVYMILKELGGKATTRQIKERALEKFPDLTLYSYVRNRLNKLKKKGFVRNYPTKNDKNELVWEIIAEWI